MVNTLATVPDISQETIGASHSTLLSQLKFYMVFESSAEVFQVHVILPQIPGEATLQMQQSGVQIAARIASGEL